MTYEIERTQKVRQPDPIETLQGIAFMQAITLGFLIGSQIVLSRRLKKLGAVNTLKEVVVVVKEAKEER